VTGKPLLARWGSLLWILGVGGGIAIVSAAPIHGECGFKFLSGAPCPGCGMTRATLALLGGGFAESWRLHPLALPCLLAAGAAVAMAVHEGATGRPTFRGPADRWALRAAVVFLALCGAVWVARVVVHPEWSPDPIRPGSLAARILE
jgi:hypothetical protein